MGFLEVYLDHDASQPIRQHLHLRDFEAPMCRALYCTGYMQELEEMFDPDKEVVTYRNADELLDKTQYYLEHPAEADRIRQAGYARALQDHTYQRRFEQLVSSHRFAILNMSQAVLFSVIIPTCNRSKQLLSALDSVFVQTFTDYEILVIDDGSTDDTGQVVQVYQERVIYIRQANAGISVARNTGIERAQGTWIAFLDDDDRWYPRKLEAMADENVHFVKRVEDMESDAVLCQLPCRPLSEQRRLRVSAAGSTGSGRPVIAYAAGGALETVLQKESGIFFQEQTAISMIEAILEFESRSWDARVIRQHAERFDLSFFKQSLIEFIGSLS